MVAINDRVNVYSDRAGTNREATVKSPRANGYWLIQYDNGEMATKVLSEWDVITPDVPESIATNEYENVKEQSFVVVVNDTELTDFGDDELGANRFALRAYRNGDTAHVFERKLVESFRIVDPL